MALYTQTSATRSSQAFCIRLVQPCARFIQPCAKIHSIIITVSSLHTIHLEFTLLHFTRKRGPSSFLAATSQLYFSTPSVRVRPIRFAYHSLAFTLYSPLLAFTNDFLGTYNTRLHQSTLTHQPASQQAHRGPQNGDRILLSLPVRAGSQSLSGVTQPAQGRIAPCESETVGRATERVRFCGNDFAHGLAIEGLRRGSDAAGRTKKWEKVELICWREGDGR